MASPDNQLQSFGVQFDVVKPKKTKCSCLKSYWVVGFMTIIFASCAVASIIMWCTDVYDDQMFKIVTLTRDGLLFKFWENVPIPTLVYVYIFNYTNHEEALNGTERPRVVEVGPYVYKEIMSRVNIVDNGNSTWSYQESRTHEFVPELSVGDPSEDIVTVPNIPLITAISQQTPGGFSSLFENTAVKFLQKGLQPQPFQSLTAYDFTWSYGDMFGSVSKTLAAFKRRPVPKKFGILAQRDGLNEDVRTVWSGVSDFEKVNFINRFNGRSRIGLWDDGWCDSFAHATDGTIFPPKGFTRDSKLYIYVKDFCRSVPLEYKEDVTHREGYPMYRYIYSPDTFASPDRNPYNACFCNVTECLPSGAFSISKCSYGAPLVASFPHFLYGSESLFEGVEGLKPVHDKHYGYMDIHTTLGLPIGGNSRFQIGIRVRNSKSNPTFNGIADGTILPMSWLDFEVGQSDSLNSLLYHYTFTAYRGKMLLKWGSPVGMLLFGVILIVLVRKMKRNQKSHDIS